MKILKNLLIILVVLAFSGFILILQLNIALKSTVLSSDYFNKMLVDSKISQALTDAIELPDSKSFYDEAWDASMLAPLNATLIESIDKNWMRQQAPILLKGIHSYVLGLSESLPVIELSAVKKNFLQSALTDLARVTKNASAEEKDKQLQSLNQRIKIDNIKENFDLSEFAAKLYSTGTNPLQALRELVNSYNQTVLILFPLIAGMLLLIISLINYSTKPTFIWTGAGLFLSGIIGLLTGIWGRGLNTADIAPGFENTGTNAAAKAIIGYCISGMSNILFIEGAILLLLGAALLITGCLVFKKPKAPYSLQNINQTISENKSQILLENGTNEKQTVKSGYKLHNIIRSAVVIILILAIPAILFFAAGSFRVSITKLSESLESTSSLLKSHDAAEAAIQVSGAEFINERFDPSNAVEDRTKGILTGVLVELLDGGNNPVSRVDIAVHKDKPDGPALVIYNLVTRENGKVNKFSLQKGTYYIEVVNNGKIPENLKLPEKPLEINVNGAENMDVIIHLQNK